MREDVAEDFGSIDPAMVVVLIIHGIVQVVFPHCGVRLWEPGIDRASSPPSGMEGLWLPSPLFLVALVSALLFAIEDKRQIISHILDP